MNKQEAIKTIEQDKIQVGRFTEVTREENAIRRKVEMVDYVPLEAVVSVIDKINEPQKPIVPKFVSDWLEEMKQDDRPLYSVMSSLMNKTNHEWTVWKSSNMNFSEIVAKAYLYGYTVEQEKLYIVEIPNPHTYIDNHSRLARNYKGKVVLEVQDWLNTDESYKLTESEIKQDFEWAFQFAKPVEE